MVVKLKMRASECIRQPASHHKTSGKSTLLAAFAYYYLRLAPSPAAQLEAGTGELQVKWKKTRNKLGMASWGLTCGRIGCRPGGRNLCDSQIQLNSKCNE